MTDRKLARKGRRHAATGALLGAGLLCGLIAACAGPAGSGGAVDRPAKTIGAADGAGNIPMDGGDAARSSAGHVNNDRVAVLFQKTVGWMETGKDADAIHGLRELIAAAPQLSVPHNNLAILYKRSGELDKAIEEYKTAIRLKPDYAEAHHNLGIAYRETGRFREAEASYRESIRLDPDRPVFHFNLAVLYELYLDRPQEAVRHYRHYLELGGNNRKEVELWISVLDQATRQIGANTSH